MKALRRGHTWSERRNQELTDNWAAMKALRREFLGREVACPCRDEGSSFILNEGGKEVPKPCLGLPFLEFTSHGRSSTGDAFFYAAAEQLFKREATTPSSLNTRKAHPE